MVTGSLEDDPGVAQNAGKMTPSQAGSHILGPMTEPSQWYRKHGDEWEAALVTLRAEGWTVKHTGLAAPLQLEGRLPTGEVFYFRARHDEVSLGWAGMIPPTFQIGKGERHTAPTKTQATCLEKMG